MRALLKFLFVVVVIAVIAGGIAWVIAGRAVGPAIQIRQPGLKRCEPTSLLVALPLVRNLRERSAGRGLL